MKNAVAIVLFVVIVILIARVAMGVFFDSVESKMNGLMEPYSISITAPKTAPGDGVLIP